ncbi:MAG: hypothetical protein KIT84_18660 [Labilithrix sp.]|nr:hypothetical protein [Labilithrix sp.]MCW5813056.1 hypothetical protein [Labilithrix sp.]
MQAKTPAVQTVPGQSRGSDVPVARHVQVRAGESRSIAQEAPAQLGKIFMPSATSSARVDVFVQSQPPAIS